MGLVSNLEDIDVSKSESGVLKKFEKFSQYGTLAKITSEESSSYSFNSYDRNYKVTKTFSAIAIARFRVLKYTKKSPYYLADVELLKDDVPQEMEAKLRESPAVKELKKLGVAYLEMMLRPEIYESRRVMIEKEENIVKLVFVLCGYLEVPAGERLRLLQIEDLNERIAELSKALKALNQERQLTNELDEKVRKEINQEGKNLFLKRKLSEINKQLYGGDVEDEFGVYEKRIKEAQLPENVLKVVQNEVKKLKSSAQSHSAEANVIRNYIDTILDLPWTLQTKDINDLQKAEAVLERDHFGLEKVKKRILEFLAVRNLKGNSKGSIICLHGPPGVGKTSLGKSIAESLGRKFERISLGGVRDEAEVRGHRRTYVGALPGVFIHALRKCKSKNPVILLDEIDKLTRDFRGDPSSALLEVLDPAQNNSFTDHYLALPFDLSNVLFIATANRIDSIQPALLDRLELINIPGYTTEEKTRIAEKYLVARQVEENGLKPEHLTILPASMDLIIKGYTREAGVRELERIIGSLCRSVAVKYSKHLQSDKAKEPFPLHTVTPDHVVEILGPAIYEDDIRDRLTQPGIAIGMAWTAVGGRILYIEASRSRGRGKIEITGQLGDVMKESVLTGLGWIKANMDKLGIDVFKFIPLAEKEKGNKANLNIFDFIDLNIHFPAAASPKDGPSAGVTIVTAIVLFLVIYLLIAFSPYFRCRCLVRRRSDLISR